MRTRLEYIIRSRRLKPSALARRAGYSRQHLARMRDGLPSRMTQARNSYVSELGIRALLDSGEVLLDRNPRRAETLCSLASNLAAELSSTPASLAHSLRGQKGRANALRMSGRYGNALDRCGPSAGCRAAPCGRATKRRIGRPSA